MRVEVVLTETDIAQEFAEAMEARDLPEKFFYWFPRSVAEWEVLAANPELYGGLAATWGRMTGYIQSLTQHITGQIPVISFGAGEPWYTMLEHAPDADLGAWLAEHLACGRITDFQLHAPPVGAPPIESTNAPGTGATNQ